jgi:glyoxylase-like metal-dependent hydrolase (beta-lactamase superfamily II)
MSQEITPGLFRLEIPLPESPLKYLNAYLIKGPQRNLLIDTGLNRSECLEAMLTGLRQLAVALERTDIFITHLHADHFGLVLKLATPDSRILFSRPEREIIENWEGFEPMIAYAARNGFPEAELRHALAKHPANRFGSDWVPDMSLLDDGDVVECGDYRFQCVTTPGHTMGHTCLYEASRQLLVAGDHILDDITPNIQCWSDEQNPLRHYLASLDKTDRLAVRLALPGHRRLIHDHRARIAQLKAHHFHRLDEIRRVLRDGGLSAYQTASRMQWDIECDSWEQFPVTQKWFATGEALAHLRFLEEAGELGRSTRDGTVRFHLRHP